VNRVQFWLFIGFLAFTIAYVTVQPIYISGLEGDSMEPELSEGDIIVYSQYATPEEGSIVVYEYEEDTQVGHRVIEETESGYITKGDNNDYKDAEKIRHDEIEGSVIVTVPTGD